MSIKSRIEQLERRAGGGGEEQPIVVKIRWLDHDGNEINMGGYDGGRPAPPMRLPAGKPNVRYIQVRRPPVD